MTARGMGPNHRTGKGEFGRSKTGSREDLRRANMLSAEKKDIERLIV